MIKVGTCSWAEKTLLKSGEFYPEHIKTAEDRLKYYSSKFDTVEIDSTYYAIPNQQTAFLWSQRTPADFTFHVKVYGALTGHGIDVKTIPKYLRSLVKEKDLNKRFVYIKELSDISALGERFIDSLNPLIRTEKLGLLVFQYPPWFHYSNDNLDYILFCKKLSQGLPIGVEFRHGSWLILQRRDSVFNFLKDHSITYVTPDEPQYNTMANVPFVPQHTTDTAYFRFHGRNSNNWLKKGIETSLRYDYLYSRNDLKDFIPIIRQYNKQIMQVFVMFNNCHGGFAIRNAFDMIGLLNKESNR